MNLQRIRHVALDMDGTIYLGDRVFPYTLDFLKRLRDKGIGYTFLTNNPTRSVADYQAKLARMGIPAAPENIYTTATAAIHYIQKHYPGAQQLFILGTDSMVHQFREAGFEICLDDPEDVPEVLVVSFDMTLTYKRLCRAAWWASQGIPYIATNPDRVCPTEEQTILVDCGSIQKCIEYATGRKADIVLGKPDPTLLQDIMDRYGLAPDEIAMVGDRLYTDMALARNAGCPGVLVLSGETTEQAARSADTDGLLVVRDIAQLGDLICAER